MNSNLKETTVVLTRKRMRRPSPPFLPTSVQNLFQTDKENSDLFFCITSFFFAMKKVHRNVCCPRSLHRMLPIATYKLAPLELMQPFSIRRQPQACPLCLYLYGSQSVFALKGFESEARTPRDIPVSSRVVMNRSHGRPQQQQQKQQDGDLKARTPTREANHLPVSQMEICPGQLRYIEIFLPLGFGHSSVHLMRSLIEQKIPKEQPRREMANRNDQV